MLFSSILFVTKFVLKTLLFCLLLMFCFWALESILYVSVVLQMVFLVVVIFVTFTARVQTTILAALAIPLLMKYVAPNTCPQC